MYGNKLLRKVPEANEEGVRKHCNVLHCQKGVCDRVCSDQGAYKGSLMNLYGVGRGVPR